MKLNFLKSILTAALFSSVVVGCINSDDYDTPASVGNCTEPELVANKTVAEISNAAPSSATLYESVTTDVIEGYVTSSDERGDFFKTISLQTIAAEGQAPVGFSVQVDETSLYGKRFKPGNKVYVILNGLHRAKEDGSLRIGNLFNGRIGRIAEAAYGNNIIASCQEVEESMLVRTMTITQAKNNANINTLIELNNVQFVDADVGEQLYDAANDLGGATNRKLVGAAGNDIIFRTSGFANFNGMTIPANSGKVRGVLTKFGSDFQFVARSADDIQLTNPRITDDNPGEEPEEPEEPGEEPEEPTEGAAFVFPAGDFENFPAFLASVNSFGIKSYATQSAGTGRDGSASLSILATPAANEYVFTTNAHSGLPSTYSKINFYMKGTSGKSVSLNVYKTDGTYYVYSLGDISSSVTLAPAPNNQYSGVINTNNEWVLITLDLTGITDLNTTNVGASFFALKVGSNAPYDLHFDNFTIE